MVGIGPQPAAGGAVVAADLGAGEQVKARRRERPGRRPSPALALAQRQIYVCLGGARQGPSLMN